MMQVLTVFFPVFVGIIRLQCGYNQYSGYYTIFRDGQKREFSGEDCVYSSPNIGFRSVCVKESEAVSSYVFRPNPRMQCKWRIVSRINSTARHKYTFVGKVNNSCFTDGLHHIPVSGHITLDILSNLSVIWNTQPANTDPYFKDQVLPSKRSKRALDSGCLVHSIPWIGAALSDCNNQGSNLKQEIERRAQERFEETKEYINNIERAYKNDSLQIHDLITQYRTEVDLLTKSEEKFRVDMRKFDEKVVESFKNLSSSLFDWETTAGNTTERMSREIIALHHEQIEVKMNLILDKLLFLTRLTDKCEEFGDWNWVESNVMKKVIHKATLNEFHLEGLKTLLIKKDKAFGGLISRISAVANKSLQVDTEQERFIETVSENGASIARKLNRVIHNDTMDVLTAISSKGRNYSLLIIDIIISIGTIVIAFKYFYEVNEIRRRLLLLICIILISIANLKNALSNVSFLNLIM